MATVSLPIGDWIDAIAKPAIDILTAALITTMATWTMAKAPAPIAALIKTALAEQLFSRASTYAINADTRAAHGEVLSVNVGNVVAKMTQYILDHAPSWLIAVERQGQDRRDGHCPAQVRQGRLGQGQSIDRPSSSPDEGADHPVRRFLHQALADAFLAG